MMAHDELQELLGAYALHALDAEEAALIERHLGTCPRCRAELADHREMAALLGYAGGQAPEGLWERIAERVEEAPPVLRLERFARAPADGRRRPLIARLVVAVAVAAVAAVAVLGVQVARLDQRTSHLNALVQQNRPDMSTIVAALSTPGAKQVQLTSSSSGQRLRAVITPDGSGYLFDSTLRPLPDGRTYQLWGLQGPTLVSYGLLGRDPGIMPFHAGTGVLALAVTAEQAGGVAVSTHKPVVVGPVRRA